MTPTEDKSKEKRDQFIIAYLPNLSQTQVVVSHAVALAQMLHKGLILLHVNDSTFATCPQNDAEQTIHTLRDTVAASYADTNYCIIPGKTADIIETLPELLNAVAIVAQVDRTAPRKSPTHPKQLLRNFANCKVAFLTAQTTKTDSTPPASVALTVDFKHESKEKFIWSSYFARFGGSSIHTLYYDYRDPGLRSKWYANMQFLHKFYTNLGITFKPHIMQQHANWADVDGIEFAAESHYDLIVSVTTAERDVMEYIIGVQEHRTIVNRHNIPVMYLNPRDDFFILCD
ncbi:MAG: hypothetical protein IJV22_06950 [Bacteroidales bacterium]|nr:hypothetical protein [Bacteroidales bacterium]